MTSQLATLAREHQNNVDRVLKQTADMEDQLFRIREGMRDLKHENHKQKKEIEQLEKKLADRAKEQSKDKGTESDERREETIREERLLRALKQKSVLEARVVYSDMMLKEKDRLLRDRDLLINALQKKQKLMEERLQKGSRLFKTHAPKLKLDRTAPTDFSLHDEKKPLIRGRLRSTITIDDDDEDIKHIPLFSRLTITPAGAEEPPKKKTPLFPRGDESDSKFTRVTRAMTQMSRKVVGNKPK